MGKLAAKSPDQGTNLSTIDGAFSLEVDAADGTVAIKEGNVLITKGSAIALTLAPPTAGADDGKVLRIVSTTAFAHVVTCSDGFNAKASSGTATFGAAKGNAANLVAYNGHWYNFSEQGITYA
jgi:hypothetical protein